MCFHMFLEILWTLEGFAAKLAAMRLQWDMDADVGSDVVAFDDLNAAGSPRTLQIEIVGTLATYMTLANVILCNALVIDDFATVAANQSYIKLLGAAGACAAALPLAHKIVMAACRWWYLLSIWRLYSE